VLTSAAIAVVSVFAFSVVNVRLGTAVDAEAAGFASEASLAGGGSAAAGVALGGAATGGVAAAGAAGLAPPMFREIVGGGTGA
jgi:hypothetical protein